MSHGPMTVEQARLYERQIDEDPRIALARRKRYESNLREEYRTMKDKQIQLVNRDGTPSCRIDIEELFDMFVLTKNWREYVSSEF